MGLKLYYVDDEYIDYLNKFDSKIEFNKCEARPYIGVILSVNQHDYFTSLTSPKPKHKHMSNGRDFQKIAGGSLGAINLNNMIPVDSENCKMILFKDVQNVYYRNLLMNQFRIINYMADDIHAKACSLYNFRTQHELSDLKYVPDIKLFNRCCDFKTLEKAAAQYHEIKLAEKEAAATKETPKRFLPGRKRSNDEITR